MPIHDWKRVNAGIFHHFHQQWVSALCDALNMGSLPPGYFALAEQVASEPIPHVLAFQKRTHQSELANDGGIAITNVPPSTKFVSTAEINQYAARANRIAIHHTLGLVVAVIEIVSPGNKDSRGALRAFVEKAIGFLKRLLGLVSKRLLVIWDRSPIHRHRTVKSFIEGVGESRLVVEFLPAYAPELNPVEWFWAQLKDVELCNKPGMDLEELHSELHVAIARIRKHPDLVAAFFKGAGLPIGKL